MAVKRTAGDVMLDYKNIDFANIKEKGLPDPSEQSRPLRMISLFGGIGADYAAMMKAGYCARHIDYVEVLRYACRAFDAMFDHYATPQDIRTWSLNPDILVHGSPCFTGDTLVKTAQGILPIRDVTTENTILYKGKEYRILNHWNNGVKNIITLQFNDGSSVNCTPNHKFLCEGPYGEYWLEAGSLMANSAVIVTDIPNMYRYVCNVLYPEDEEVFDIEVETIHRFPLGNGIIVHNCQDLSNEGKNDFSTGRSILFERTLQILDPECGCLTTLPKVVIWENVPRLMWAYKDILNYYIETMESFGYISHVEKLRASDYNIPQDRERVFVVSIQKNIPHAKDFTFPKKVEPTWKFIDFIDKSISMDDPSLQPSEREKEILFYLPDGTLAVKEGTKKGYAEIHEGMCVNLARPDSKTRRGRTGYNCKTITCGPRMAVYHNGKLRMLHAKEYLRLMGYRDLHYKRIHDAGVEDKEICSLAGNSICVPVLEAIFLQLSAYGIIPTPEETWAANDVDKPKKIANVEKKVFDEQFFPKVIAV